MSQIDFSAEVIQKVNPLIDSSSQIFLPLHESADGDMVGSALAFREFLKGRGKSTYLIVAEPISEIYSFLPGFSEIHVSKSLPDLSRFDLFVFLDGGSNSDGTFLDRYLSEANWSLPIDSHTIFVDHHLLPPREPRPEIVLWDPSVSSTCEILFYLFKALCVPLNQTLARSLLLGLLTDTGYFTQQNTTHEALRAAAEIVSLGFGVPEISRQTIWNLSEDEVQYLALFLKNTKINRAARFNWTQISYMEFFRFLREKGIFDLNVEYHKNLLLRGLRDSRFAFVLHEKEPGHVTVSFRSRDENFDVGSLARLLGGGGHYLASGALVKNRSLENAEKYVLGRIDEYLKDYEKEKSY